MAMDPNHALRTHQRLFTGAKALRDDALYSAGLAAIPKCTTCGSPVLFDGNTPKHYDGRWDKDVLEAVPAFKASTAERKGYTPKDHEATAEKPTQIEAFKVTGVPKPMTSAGKAAAARRSTLQRVPDSVRTQANNINQNLNLGRQWNPTMFDENGIAKPTREL